MDGTGVTVDGEGTVGANSAPASAPLSLGAYAKHRGTSKTAVWRAVQRGRLHKSLVYDAKGNAKVADVARADQEWAASTDLTKAPGYVKERAAAAPPPATDKPKGLSPPLPDSPAPPDQPEEIGDVQARKLSLADASALEKDWKARHAELDYRERAGELVNAKEIEARIVDDYTNCRTKLLGLSRKVKARYPHLAADVIAGIDGLIREALEDLANGDSTP